MEPLKNKLNIAILSPVENAYSETFIQAHRNHLGDRVFFYYGGLIPQYLFGSGRIGLGTENGLDTLKQSLIQNEIDVVLAEYGYTAAESLPAIKRADIPLVVHFHGNDAYCIKVLEDYRDRYGEFFEYASKVIVVSRDMRQKIISLGCPEEKILYAPYGPNDDFFSVSASFQTRQFLAVGRFVDKKAPYYTILAFSKVLSNFPDSTLRMAADGPLLEMCKNIVRHLKIEKNVKFIGILDREQIKQEMAKSLAFVQHSIKAENGDSEGTPVAILEAGAAGLPVISTRHAGIKDVVIEGETGFLVDEHNVEEMYESMNLLLCKPSLAKKMGKVARERIKKSFSIERHISLVQKAVIDSVNKKMNRESLMNRKINIDYGVQDSVSDEEVRENSGRSSIVITCHNYGRFLRHAIHSALNQTIKPKEIIVVNDASTDETNDIAESFGDKIQYFIVDFENAQKTRNFGLGKCSGEYVVFLDADDYLDNNFLKFTQEEMKRDEDLALVYTNRINIIDKKYRDRIGLSREWITEDFDFKKLTKRNYISLSSLIRRKYFRGFDEKIKRFQDWDAWLTLLKNRRAKKINKFLFFVRFHGENKTFRVAFEAEKLKILIKHGLLKLSSEEILNRFGEAIQRKEEEIWTVREIIRKKDEEIKKKLNSCRYEIAEALVPLNSTIRKKDRLIRQKDEELRMVKSSIFWKARKLYLRIKYFRLKNVADLASKGYKVYKEKGLKKFLWSLYKYILHGQEYFQSKTKPKTDYEIWIEKNEKWDRREIEKETEKFEHKPKISIITPVYNVDPKWLDKCLESVQNQLYENWELCLHDDASTKKETIECLKKWKEKEDPRLKISFGKENQHISGASNEALKIATGEFVALLDNDDELSPDALFENVKLLNKHPEADFIYSDEDKISEKGERTEPFFKPDWSPDLFLSQMYTCHLGVYRKSIIDEIGGFRKGYEGSQDYDLVLRFIEKTNREKIFHIPKVLYHWRKISGSMAGKETAKGYASGTAKKALFDYLKRNQIEGEVLDGKFPGTYRVRRKIPGKPKVSIIIPFKDEADVLRECVNSILDKTRYKNYEIILVDNQSKDQKTIDYIESLKNNSVIRILKYDKPFNFSAINNFAVGESKGEYILFLNNDVEVISEEWLEAMLEHAQRPEVGAVGAKLLYPDNTIQHAGVVMGLGIAGHAFKHIAKEDPGYFFHPHLIRNYCCVTAACLMVKKELCEEIGGFDKENLPIAFNDVDFCLRLLEKGYYNVWTPFAELYHHESWSRGDDNEKDLEKINPEKFQRVKKEELYMREKWEKYLRNDPFYSPNLTRRSENFGLRLEE